jgi:hypothetical protein
MKQFEVGKKYKFDMAMKQEFFDAHDCNEEVFYDLAQFDYEITVSYIEGDIVHYRGDYFFYQTDIEFFFLVADVPVQKENVASDKSESEIVKAWFEKLKCVTDRDSIYYLEYCLSISDTHGGWWSNDETVDIVINVYEERKRQEKEHSKQTLLDKKKALELQLAQINEQLGE